MSLKLYDKNAPRKRTYFDEYIVKFKYQKPDTFWVTEKASVFVNILIDPFNDEKRVTEIVLEEFPNAQIITITCA